LIEYIAHAFRHVQLDGGMTIYEGESRDRYGDPREERLALTAERVDWRRVPVDDLVARHCALSFLDAQGFRFYTPAIMTVIVNDLDEHGMLTESFLFHIHDIRASCKFRDTHYCTLYNQAQRAAIIRFVKYLAHNVRGGWHDDAMERTLAKLPECCRRMQHVG
jgi:hypothetical protein